MSNTPSYDHSWKEFMSDTGAIQHSKKKTATLHYENIELLLTRMGRDYPESLFTEVFEAKLVPVWEYSLPITSDLLLVYRMMIVVGASIMSRGEDIPFEDRYAEHYYKRYNSEQWLKDFGGRKMDDPEIHHHHFCVLVLPYTTP